MDWTQIYLFAISTAICGVTWIRYLLDPDGLLSGFPIWLDAILEALKIKEKPAEKIRWALTQCEKCFSGQLAFWAFPFLPMDYAWWIHIFFTLNTIFFAGIINAIMRRYL